MSEMEEISVEGIDELTVCVWQVGDSEWGSNFIIGAHQAAIREGYPTREAAIIGAAGAAKTWHEGQLLLEDDAESHESLKEDIAAVDAFLAMFGQANNVVQVEDEECTDPVKMAAALKQLREELPTWMVWMESGRSTPTSC